MEAGPNHDIKNYIHTYIHTYIYTYIGRYIDRWPKLRFISWRLTKLLK
jgi:hypothetical protein